MGTWIACLSHSKGGVVHGQQRARTLVATNRVRPDGAQERALERRPRLSPRPPREPRPARVTGLLFVPASSPCPLVRLSRNPERLHSAVFRLGPVQDVVLDALDEPRMLELRSRAEECRK